MTEYKGHIQISMDDFAPCEKLPWQLLIDTWLTSIWPEDRELLAEECEYILKVLKEEKENEKNND